MSAPETAAAPAPVEEVKPTEAPAATEPTPAATDKSKSFSELPAGTRTTYDKQGLLRKNTLVKLQQNRRQLHHYDLSAPRHTEATRAARKLRKHSKGKDHAEPRAPKEATDPAEPSQAPAAAPEPPAPAAAKPAQAKPAKKKDPKAPKPDPTQPLPGQQ